LILVGAFNMAIQQAIARANLSQNMSFAATGKERCAFASFCEILDMRRVFAQGS